MEKRVKSQVRKELTLSLDPNVLAAVWRLGLLLLASAVTLDLNADEPVHTPENTLVEEVVVWGRSESQAGTAMTASEGLVGFDDFSTRPLARVGELVETVPGLVASQHSGEGKANQYFLRGVNLDHGTDFSAYFEGVPLNFRSHAHGHGYLDLNFLIPEIVSTVRYQKGPYSPDRGDFSSVGTTSFSVYDSVERPFVDVGGGEYDFFRVVAAGSVHVGNGHLLGAAELSRSDGPWDLPSDVKKHNVLLKYTGHWNEVHARALVSYYENSWTATDQVPMREVESGRLGRFGFVDPTLGGETERTILSFSVEADRWEAGAYAINYSLDLFSNFTYFLNDAANGDQFQQADERWVYGLYGKTRFDLGEAVTLTLGGDIRVDDVSELQLNQTRDRQLLTRVRDDGVRWSSLGTYAQFDLQLSEKLRTSIGLRHDYFDYDVDSIPLNTGSGDNSNLVASVSLAYQPSDSVELYANWGQGYHSNDVRGATNTVDPVDGSAVAPVDVFADQEGAELGARFETGNGIVATLTGFWLKSDSELLFVGDAGNTEPSDGSTRKGVEFGVFWSPQTHWALDVTGAVVNSKFTGVPSALNEIPNTFGEVFSAGITYADPKGLEFSARARHFGDAPIVEDGSVEQQSSTIVNAGIGYAFKRWKVGVDLLNVFDSRDSDIAYLFDSRLATETEAVEDVHFHPVLPRTLRAHLRFHFD